MAIFTAAGVTIPRNSYATAEFSGSRILTTLSRNSMAFFTVLTAVILERVQYCVYYTPVTMFNSYQNLKRLVSSKTCYTILDDTNVYCNSCSQTVRVSKKSQKFCLKSHEESNRHKTNFLKWNKSRQISTREQLIESRGNEFYQDIAELFTFANLALDKLTHPIFTKFFQKWCSKRPPDASTIRKFYMRPIYEKIVRKIRAEIGSNWIYVQLDESVINGRRIYSILIGKLDGNPSDTYLLDILQIEDNANNVNAVQSLSEALKVLWPEALLYENVRLLISDQAAYMLKAGANLREGLFPKLMHITCLCHALSRVCEEIRVAYPKIDRIVTYLKNVLVRSPRRMALLEEMTRSKLVSFPVATRWGTWVRFCDYLFHNLEGIREFTESIFDEDSASIGHLMRWLNESSVLEELSEISTLQVLPKCIEKLERNNMLISEQKKIIDDLKEQLPVRFREKLERCLRKNPSLEDIFAISDPRDRLKYRYAPLSSVEVERSFSQIKHILTDQRMGLTKENFRQLSVVYCNANKFSHET